MADFTVISFFIGFGFGWAVSFLFYKRQRRKFESDIKKLKKMYDVD